MADELRVLLADDHPLVREGLQKVFSAQHSIRVVGEAADGEEAILLAAKLHPDVVLLDITMPRVGGLEAMRRLRRLSPQPKVLILTIHDRPEFVEEFARAGACGYVVKTASPQELVRAVMRVHGGGSYFPRRPSEGVGPAAASHRPRLLFDLTPREQDVLIAVAEGHSNKEIASRLGVGQRTVETHRANLRNKLNIHSSAGLARFAVAKGLVQPH
jgi:two-component system nitrate/nitrite response regulator NarL